MSTASLPIHTLRGRDLSGRGPAVVAGDIPMDTPVAEIISEMTRALSLPRDTTYNAEYKGRKLNRSDTLEEAGLPEGAELVLHPEVTAGGSSK